MSLHLLLKAGDERIQAAQAILCEWQNSVVSLTCALIFLRWHEIGQATKTAQVQVCGIAVAPVGNISLM